MSSEARARLADLMARHGVNGILKLDNDSTWEVVADQDLDHAPAYDLDTACLHPHHVVVANDQDTQDLPLDRVPHLALAAAVLAVPKTTVLEAAHCATILPQLRDHAWEQAALVRRRCDALPPKSPLRPLVEASLREADRRLPELMHDTLAHAQSCARLVRTLYLALDQLDARQQGPPEAIRRPLLSYGEALRAVVLRRAVRPAAASASGDGHRRATYRVSFGPGTAVAGA
ncbi:hypothetical protein GCM10010329_81570 [Streptomyces spiroverticillatus]|uniref:Uncharacterized protein n=1 Tax=Streptomyces finlayi TaxID=67296 RepID=A0A918X7Z2_9ACTN|nr:hypothetical protein [Streptomyces finlayi]GHA46606.1 hypothetical protein GCM10010329_81570 [Streptomyces spiroverticillatus]GHD16155.1 hypothetical protein GCM10010334_76940 [Streptomyces finlayi]